MEKRSAEGLAIARNLVLTVLGFYAAIAVAALLIFKGADALPDLLRMGGAFLAAAVLFRLYRRAVEWWAAGGKDFRG
jgi:Zn-dependent membrane protease YugP